MAAKKDEFKYELIEHVADLSEEGKGWTKEVNIMKWGNSKKLVIDIRKWNRDDDENIKVGKGISLSLDEFKMIQKINIKNIEKCLSSNEE